MTTHIDYTSKDYASFRSDMLLGASTRLPEWTTRNPGDFGVVMVEVFAEALDRLSFYGDRIANEAFIQTAVLRSSILKHAEMLDYRPAQNSASSGTVTLTALAGYSNVLVPAGTKFSTPSASSVTGEPVAPVIFETVADVTIPADATGVYIAPAEVVQGETINEVIGISDATADQEFALLTSPVIEGTVSVTVNEGFGDQQWFFYDHLIDAEYLDQAYDLYTDEVGVTYVRFGDGVNGRIPTNGATVSVAYRTGGGEVGNVAVQTVNQIVTPVVGLLSVSNPAAISGGKNAESNDEIRSNAIKSLRTLERAVNNADYATLALRTTGVARAKATNLGNTVTLRIAPTGGGNASEFLKDQVLNYLVPERSTLGHTVIINDPNYVPINVTATIHVLANYGREATRLEAIAALKTMLAFNNLDFGEDITLGKTYRVLLNLPGVEWAEITVLSTTSTGVGDIAIADTSYATEGTLVVNADGGILGT